METKEIKWSELRRPPASALKTITGGRLRGKSDISPQWRIDVMNQTFGHCGLFWSYEITRQWTEQGSDGEVMAFCNINLFIKVNDEWSRAIPGTGGSMLIAKETAKWYNSDEAYKMALTDALSVAMKGLGVAADIYLGLYDGSKYSKGPEQPKPEQAVRIRPKITPTQFQQAFRRIEGGELAIFDKTVNGFELTPEQVKDLENARAIFLKKIAEREAQQAEDNFLNP